MTMRYDARPQPPANPSRSCLLLAAEVQDTCWWPATTWNGCRRLLSDACDTLMRPHAALAGAITALQFQDMASQLIDHTTSAARLRRPPGARRLGRRRGRRIGRGRGAAAAPQPRDPGRDGRRLDRAF
jgi:hypothetical protein